MLFGKRVWIIPVLFFCSGATALVYEVVWSKFLSQMFGSTIYAQTVVLAVFMGGLAVGNRLFGRRADQSKAPLRIYGVLEAAIGLYAFLFPILSRGADELFVLLGSGIAEHTYLLLVLKGVLSALLLLGPTILMGGTLPLIAAWLEKFSGDAGRQSAQFYALNSLGAVAGAGLAGFFLVQRFGMIWTLWLTACSNLAIGIIAIAINRTTEPEATVADPTDRTTAADRPARWSPAGVIVAFTGGISMGLEVLSSRSLALIFGSSLQTFAVVLMAFILGIGLGSAWIAARRGSGRVSERTIAGLICLAAAWITLLVFNIERWVDWYRIAVTGLARTDMGYFFYQMLTVGMSLLILGVPAALIGAVLPLTIRLGSGGETRLGAKVGALLTWNTLGAVTGTLLTGFVLMPLLGLRNAFGVLALALAVIGLVLTTRRREAGEAALRYKPFSIAAALGVCLFASSLFVFGDDGWRHAIGTGMFRLRETEFDPRFLPMLKEHVKILSYEDASDATVIVEEVDGIIGPRNLGLRINGKPDAGTSQNVITQLLLGHLPLLAKPDAKDVFVLGLGSGMTAAAVLSYPVDRLVVAENCAPVIRAAQNFFPEWNRHALDDPRTRVYAEDGRTVLKLRRQLYDVIIAEPSNPWTVGVGSVFSREFYQIAARHLKPAGIVAQWFHVYEMNDEIVSLVLRTFGSVFPYVEIWDSGGGDIIMLGAMQPWPTGTQVFQEGFAIDRVRTDLWMIDIHSPEMMLARQLASQRTGFAIGGKGPIQSDRFPVLDIYAAPKAFFLNSASLLLERFDERTRQQVFASADKLTELRALPFPATTVLFGSFSTMNNELQRWLIGAPVGGVIPCVFATPRGAPAMAAPASLAESAAQAFAIGDSANAHHLLTLALQQNPADPYVLYVSRVIARARETQKQSAATASIRQPAP